MMFHIDSGSDGSRSVTAQVDPTAVGKKFTPATVTKNGNASPPSEGSDNSEHISFHIIVFGL
jgi:hypothetical protein